MANFFIDRPIFAIALAIAIMVAGALAIFSLPIEQYPSIAPPSIQVNTTYPGASAETVESTVVQVIEQQMNGIDHLIYLASTSDNFGTGTVTLSFAPGTNPDIAQVQVQNKLQLALPLLPAAVQQLGVSVTKSSTSYLLVAGFVSTDGSMSKFDIADYVVSHIQDPVSRINGVGNLNVFGTQYAMRIWLDPNKLNDFALTPVDVANALQAQNVQVSAGQLGGTPAVAGQRLNAAITEATLLRTPEQFGRVVLKVNTDGSRVLLRDVARVERGAESYNVDNKYNGKPAAGIGFQLASGANALQTADAIKARIAELSQYFPRGLEVVYPYDTTPFVRISITEVVKTLFEGIVLVVLVILLFLQNVRATLIPAVAVPVVLLGTFGVMAALGFTINTLTMFGLVLAIGLLVDDAIVVVENVQRVMAEEGLSPREATRKAMGQLTGALLGVAVVLSAVFVPTAFTAGSVGAIYRQFALTIVVAMALSVFVAISLTPALCATVLEPGGEGRGLKRWFGWFNRWFEHRRDRYIDGVRTAIGRPARFLAIYVALAAAVALLFVRLPTSFLPSEDQGFMFVQVQTPPGQTQEFTGAVLDDVANYLRQDEARMVDAVFTVNGFNFAGRGQNQGLLFVRFKDWSERTGKALKVDALVHRMAQRFGSYKDAVIIPINLPPIRELGTAAGFDFELEDRGGIGHERLLAARNQLLAAAGKDPELALVRPNGLNDQPTFKVSIDREKASALGVTSLSDVDQTFSIAWGSRYVNNFLDTDGRIKRVYVQADAPFRMGPEDLGRWYVRNVGGAGGGGSGGANASGTMVPFSAFAAGAWSYGSPKLERYNGVPSFEIQGQAAPGKSTGQAIAAMARLAKELPAGVGYQWTGLSLQEQLSGSQAPLLFALSILVVFLSLASLYESWSIPVSVIMVVPIGVLGAVGAATAFGMSNDVYFKVGLLTTIGLSAKNAILIVEFARELHHQGRSVIDAAVEAAHLRLRPIGMTSMAFVLGVLPLALASGAGSGSENAVGTGVIGGMLTATFIAPFLIPLFFVVVSRTLGREKATAELAPPAAAPVPASPTGGAR
ncbi:MAG TPA: efflux RND transporter permease subunit [Burkholderiales bacterium]|nr:efflux RND transporter permease subunit [Burkholderiales bacterium]